MAHEVLKELLVAVGFEVDDSSYKRASEAIDNVERKLSENEKADRARGEAEQKRHEMRRRNAEALAITMGDFAKVAVGAAAVIGAAVTAMAESIRKGIGEFDRMYYVAGRTGASVNNLKALGYAFAQTGSSAQAAIGAVESFARARRANPGVDGMLRSYGVGTEGDSSDVLSNALDAIIKRHPQYTSQLIANQLGISADDVDHWIRYRKEIGKFADEYKRMQAAIGVNGGETASIAKDIMRELGRLSAVVEVLADKLTQTFAPAIKAVVTALGGIADFFADEGRVKAALAYFDPIIGAVKTLVGWLKQAYDLFVKMFEYLRASPFGKAISAIDPGYIRGKVLDALQPGSAQAATNPEGDTTASRERPGIFRRGLNAIKRGLGIGSGASDGLQGRSPEASGKYRPVYNLSDADLHQRTVDIIAGEAIRNNPESIDAVINNMLNRVGSKGWGPSKNLLDVATAPGQYEAAWKGSKASAAETEFIRSRIRAIASGGVPDNTNGSNAYRAGTYRGPWYQNHKNAPVIGGNRYAFEAGAANGPYAPYRDPKPTASAAPRMSFNPGVTNIDDLLRSSPMGSTSTSNDNSRSATMNSNVNVTVNGATDPQATASAVQRGIGSAHDISLRNVQTAIR